MKYVYLIEGYTYEADDCSSRDLIRYSNKDAFAVSNTFLFKYNFGKVKIYRAPKGEYSKVSLIKEFKKSDVI